MAHDRLKIERTKGIVTLRFNRPPANAIELGFIEDFETALDSVLLTEVSAIVLTGSGSFFSGGLDLKVVPFYSSHEQAELITRLNRMVGKLYGCPVPLIGAINGHAIAGGLILVLTCDYRIGSDGDYKLGLTEARVGIPFPGGPMAVLQAELSQANVRVTTLQAGLFGPRQALTREILDEIQSPEQLLPRAVQVAKEMGGIPRRAYQKIKQQVRESALKRIEDLVQRNSDPLISDWITSEAVSVAAGVLKKPRG